MVLTTTWTYGGSPYVLLSKTYTYPGPTGDVSIVVHYSSLSIQTNFQCRYTAEANYPYFPMPTSINLPDGTSYNIVYESVSGTYPSTNVTGRIHSLTLPSGATTTYTYSGGNNGIDCNYGTTPVLTRQTPDGTWTYTQTLPTYPNQISTVKVTDPLGNDTVYTFNNPYGSHEVQRKVYQGPSASNVVLETVLTCYNSNFTSCASATVPTFPVRKDVYTYLGTSQPSLSDTTYTSTGLLIGDKEYDFGATLPPGTNFISNTTITYGSYSAGSCSTAIAGINHRCSVVTKNSSRSTLAQTNYTYDAKSNLTNVSRLAGATYVNNSYSNNPNGTVHIATDAKGAQTTYTYGACNGAYPTSVSEPLSLSRSMSWDCNGGAITSATDENGKQTLYSYANPATGVGDPFWRVTRITYPDGGRTTTTYNDTASPANISTNQLLDGAGHSITTQTNLDGLGRSASKVDPAGNFSTQIYDATGRVGTAYNPTHCNPPTTNCGESTWGFTKYTYDALGRVIKVIPPDGTSTSNYVTTTYPANCTIVTDEASKTRKSCSDALGRLTQVFEDSSGLAYETDYTYDGLGNLLTVNQKGGSTTSSNWRTRTFTYDPLSRLLTAANPESGTTTYTYDNNGNVLTKKDARNITITYTYDALNRITGKTYSDGLTSPVVYAYDQPAPWGTPLNNYIGRLTTEYTYNGSGTLTDNLYDYDTMGRVVRRAQCQPLNCPAPSQNAMYTYNLLGSPTSLRTVQTGVLDFTITSSYDSAARLTSVTSSYVDAQHPATLYSIDPTVGYFPNGALRKATLPNGLTETAMYNNRLQPCRMEINSTAAYFSSCTGAVPGGNVLDFTYSYNSATSNNGNVASWSSVGNQTFTRSYLYDSLNRLSTFSDTATGQSCKGLSWAYDAWGNRTDQNVTAGTCGTFHAGPAGTNNRFGSPYLYDAAGNMTYDGSHNYTYDAENRVSAVDGGTTTYLYDAEGNRVMKTVSGAWRDYIYDTSGNVVAEVVATGWNVGYVYAGSQLIAEYRDTTTYSFFKDHLGSSRLVTKIDKTVYDSLDFMPFGEQLTGDTGTTHKFTGKEHASESGLDNFGARYNSSSMGRFMSPDPLLGSGRLGNPQTWNRYTYALNNPLRIVDPTGLYDWDQSAGGNMSDEELQAIADDNDNKRHKWAQSALNFRDQFRSGLDSADEAAGSSTLSDDQQSAAQAAVNAYGTENDSNGVIVGSYKSGFGATTLLNNNDSVTVMFGGSLRGDFLTATIAHEGAHVDQAQTWLVGGESAIGDLNHYAREQAAWAVGSSIAQALGMKTYAPHGGGSEYQVWNKGWKAADVQTLRSKGIENILNYSNLKPTDTDTYSNEHHQ